MDTRKPYPTDVNDEEWALISSYLELLPEASCQRRYASRDVFNSLHYVVRSGIQWRMLPYDFPPWEMVYQQSRRWLAAGGFDRLMGDLRELLREGRARPPAFSTAEHCNPPRASSNNYSIRPIPAAMSMPIAAIPVLSEKRS